LLATSAVVALALIAGTAVATWQAIRATKAGALAIKREHEAQAAVTQATQARALATKREGEAQTAAAQAKSAAAESKAVLTFLVQDMLGASAPDQALGRDVKVAEVLANAEKKIDTAFRDQPLVEAGVRHALGSSRHALGQYDLALRHATRSYELRRDLLGPEHPETLASMATLANVFWEQGKTDEARTFYEQTLEMRRRTLGPEDPDTLASTGDLVRDLNWGQGKPDEARKLCEEILEIQRRTLGPEHPNTLKSMEILAGILRQQGKPDEARKLYEQTLEIERRILGPEHPDTLWLMNGLAYALSAQGKVDEACKLLEQTLEVQRRVLGPDHPHTLWSMLKVAEGLRARGKGDETSKLFAELGRLGPEYPRDWRSVTALAISCLSAPRLQNADRIRGLEVALKMTELLPDEQLSWKWLSAAEYANGHWDAAIHAAEKCIALRKDDGWYFPWIVLALSHARRGEMDEARVWFDKARRRLQHGGGLGDTPQWIIDEAARLFGEHKRTSEVESKALKTVNVMMPNGVAAFAPPFVKGTEEAAP
jgi:tetratricopeptide (TPR) repeat protein